MVQPIYETVHKKLSYESISYHLKALEIDHGNDSPHRYLNVSQLYIVIKGITYVNLCDRAKSV